MNLGIALREDDLFFFLSGFFFHEHSRITGLQGKGEGILTPHYQFHTLHRHLDISRAINAENFRLIFRIKFCFVQGSFNSLNGSFDAI